MAIHLMCLTTNGGMPIFTRKRGDCDNLPFSTVASLNGIHMFCKSLGIEMHTTFTEDWTLIWKDFHNSITIIIAGKGLTEKCLETLMNLIFNSFSLFMNSEDFQNANILERMKREAKNYMPIVDRILEVCDSEILGYSDCILANENAALLSKLNEFSNQLGSLFCAIVISQKIAVATEGWWALDVIDRKLLVTLLNSAKSSQKDVGVYLPKKSPGTAYRFVTIPLTGTAVLCVICGAEPSYHEINNLVQQVFKGEMELLQQAERCMPRNFPENLEIDASILGLLLINKNSKKYVVSRNLQQSSSGKRTMSGSHRLDILKTFFDQAVDAIEDYLNNPTPNETKTDDQNVCKVLDQYWCSEYHKCNSYADEEGNLLCALYVASMPTYTMKIITQKTLSTILQDRSICW